MSMHGSMLENANDMYYVNSPSVLLSTPPVSLKSNPYRATCSVTIVVMTSVSTLRLVTLEFGDQAISSPHNSTRSAMTDGATIVSLSLYYNRLTFPLSAILEFFKGVTFSLYTGTKVFKSPND